MILASSVAVVDASIALAFASIIAAWPKYELCFQRDWRACHALLAGLSLSAKGVSSFESLMVVIRQLSLEFAISEAQSVQRRGKYVAGDLAR